MNRIKLTAPDCMESRIQLPSSKSICNRALILNALAKGKTEIGNLSDCDDTRVMIHALQEMPEVIDIMAAGTAMRFLTAYLSVAKGTHVITGTERMQQRPIRILVDALRELGAQITYLKEEGYPPLQIMGSKLANHRISLPGNVSSQYISALLMIGPMLEKGLTLTLTGDIISRPYIDLTLQLMHDFGTKAGWTSGNSLHVEPQPYRSILYRVESDWSAASYWYEMVALCPQAIIELPELFENSYQGDAKVAELFRPLGVETQYCKDKVVLHKTKHTAKRMEYDFVNQPDLAQTFTVTCVLLDIPFRFSGLQSLKIKETDRMAALICEMRKLGYILTETDGSILEWNGERCRPDDNPAIDTYEDHRMAMAFAPVAFRLPHICINNPQVVSKSYPRYWENLRTAGFGITEE